MRQQLSRLGLFIALSPVVAAFADDSPKEDALEEITVLAERVAITQPAGTFATVATSLRFDPLTELQSRGLPEGQADVTVRGGLFENTGFKVGAVTVMDPQTGHYFAELPVDPVSLSAPDVLQGIDNAVAGFNSNIATVNYAISAIDAGGSLLVGAGSDSLNYQSLRFAGVSRAENGSDLGVALSAARSEGDGTIDNGDHEFERVNLHVQSRSDAAQSDLILALQDKFYGWPGAYTGFATLPETDDTETTLLLANHRRTTDAGWWEVGAYYRRLKDDYDFDRTTTESGAPGSFDHETRVMAIGWQAVRRTGNIDWRFGAQFTADELARSTDLTNGNFDERRYLKASVVPSIDYDLDSGGTMTFRLGATLDSSNEDNSAVQPLAGASWVNTDAAGTTIVEVEFAETSQVPGYTVLNSRPAGLFGGNADLGREEARQLSASFARVTSNWEGRAAIFFRKDEDLVDWTYESGAPFARQANAVDLDVVGVEGVLRRSWASLDLTLGLTLLDKDSDYGTAAVDASFYALNFAKRRATVALEYRFAERFELRLDNEYRVQEDNPLRTSSDNTYLGALSLSWSARDDGGLGVALVVDNLSDSDYESFPGTPAVGRQVSLGVRYDW